ncbi:MAG: TIGR00303 family protein, partial [Oscillatoriales cyanobacterium RM1_1_9]|nr:TIGR00303 family protein [Oscillatoriales cyanobacterium RM1_1_9]
MIRVYTTQEQGQQWLERHRGQYPALVCVLGFTETGLIPGISAAGATPADRRYTAVADGEFLYNGPQPHPRYPLPPLQAGASPVLISRAVIEGLKLPVDVFDAGLPTTPSIPAINLGGVVARCVSSGQAMPPATVRHLFEQGLVWGDRLAAAAQNDYLILSECVVGGTTTALAVLLGLGVGAQGQVNSSHPQCNHPQKQALVMAGLQKAGFMVPTPITSGELPKSKNFSIPTPDIDPLTLVAAVG